MGTESQPLIENAMKQKMARGEIILSMAVRLVRTIEISSLAKAAGFDSIYVDLEHSQISLVEASQICQAAQLIGITPLVRTAGGPEAIASVLDGGAMGVIAPHVANARQAREIVKAARFPPLGERSIPGAVMPQFGYRALPAQQMAHALNEATLVVVMIESADALEQVDEIAGVDGVDMLFVGTNDLCASLGIVGQVDHPRVAEAYARCFAACRRHGRQLGIGGMGSNPAMVSRLIEQGARYVSVGTDISFLLAGASGKARQAREFSASSSTSTKDSTVAKAYWINTYREITDEAALAEYGKLAGPAIQGGGGRFVARGVPQAVYESGVPQRTVLIEFDSLQQAIATHDGPGYQAALKALGHGAVRDIRIIEAS